jgi:choline-glycine betaine transporter
MNSIHTYNMYCFCVLILKVVAIYYEPSLVIMANLSLGATIRNITPQIFVTHPTSGQHRIHIKKVFQSKLFIERLPKSCRVQNSN